MNEAEMIGFVVIALTTLIGLFFAIHKPLSENTKAMTTLSCAVNSLNEKLQVMETKNTDSHRRLWQHEEEQDNRLDNHELRIHDVEQKIGK